MTSIHGLLSYSEAESNRFNANIYRGYLDYVPVKDLAAFIRDENIDFIFFRIKSEKLNEVNNLNQLPFPFLIADTLLYYSCNIIQAKKRDLRNKDMIFKKADLGDKTILNSLVDNIFAEYKNHYLANPFLEKNKIIEGYKEWVNSYLDDDKSKEVVLVKKNNKAIAFASCSCKEDDGICEIVLNGVLPQYTGRGIYTDLIRYLKSYFQERRYKTIRVSTQSHNHIVQKVWVKENYYLSESYNTVHINSFLNRTVIEKDSFSIAFDDIKLEEIFPFCMNKNEYQNSITFEGQDCFDQRIFFNNLLNALVAKHIRKHNLPYGLKNSSCSCYTYQPISLKHKYDAEISYPYCDIGKNNYLILLKIYDNHVLCSVTYYYLTSE